MKTIRPSFVAVLFVLLVILLTPHAASAQACTVSVSIATGGTASSACFVPANQKAYVAITGTWAGTAAVEVSANGGASYAVQESTTANASFTVQPSTNTLVRVRFLTRTSGTVTGTITYGVNNAAKLKYTTEPIGSVAYGSFGISVIGSTTSSAVSDVIVSQPFLSTGAGILVGATGGTDKFVIGLYDSAGGFIASTDTAGTTASATTNAFQEIAWTTPQQLPAGLYYLLVQINGTTATFRRPASLTFVDVRTKSITSTTFGTLPPAIAVPTAMETSIAVGGTNAVGPIGYLY